MGVATTTQTHFRWQEDTANANSAGSFLFAEDVTASGGISLDTTYVIRFKVENSGSKDEDAGTYNLQYDLNNDTWADVTATSSNVISVGGADTDGDAMTELLSKSVANYGNGEYSEDGITTSRVITAGSSTEFAFPVQFVSTDLTAGLEHVRLRLTRAGTTLDGTYVLASAIMPSIPIYGASASAGAISAVTAQVGPTLELTRLISPPADWIGRMNAVGYAPTVSFPGTEYDATGSKGDANAVGYAATVSVERTALPSVGVTNAVGNTQAAGIVREAVGSVGTTNAVGYAPTVAASGAYNATGTVGNVNAVGYAPSTTRTVSVTGTVGTINGIGLAGSVTKGDGVGAGIVNAVTAQTGPTIEIIRTISPPADWVGDINANGFAATVSTQSGGITNISAGAAGRVNATGYAPFTSLDVLPGEANAVGYAPTIEIASRNPTGSVGKANATGYAAQVLRDKTVTAQLGRINARGQLGASFNTEQNTLGKANAVSAGTGPTVEIIKFTAFDQTAGEANATGSAPTIDFALGNIIAVTSVGEARGNAVGYAPAIDYGAERLFTPLVGKINAIGIAASQISFGGTFITIPAQGRANAIHAATTATIEREKTIEGPFVGKANFTGRPPNTSTETPNIYNANGTVGTINLVGYEGDTGLSREALPTVGVVNAVGYSPDETEQPSTGAANAVGYAASVGIERTVRPQLGVVQADGSIAVVEVQRGTYERVIGLGTVHAIGNRAKFQADVIKTDVDYGAGSGGKYYDDLMRQIRQEDELLLEMIEDFIRRVA